MEMNLQEIVSSLQSLRLHYTAEHIEDLSLKLQGKPPLEIIAHLVTLEVVERRNRSIHRRMQEARIGRFRRMEEFDWDWPKAIDSKAVKLQFEQDLVKERKNLVFLGPQGVGKTMIARNLASKVVYQGYSARVVTASKMVSDLTASGHNLESRLRYYSNVQLLVIDELGYLSFQDRAADLLFEVISRRYEKLPIILTSNLAFKDWPTIFPGAACVAALLDRLIHHCTILKIDGDSYRKKESQLTKEQKS